MNQTTLAERDATASPAGIVLSSNGSMFLAVGLIFGIRDAWVTAWGLNGSIAGGLEIAVFTLIPITSVIFSVTISRRHADSRSATLKRAGVVAILVGLPVAVIMAIGAAY